MKTDEQPSEEQHVQELQAALQKLPRIHLIVLDTLIKHLKECVFAFTQETMFILLIYLYSLIDCTEEGDEPNDVYISKLALGLGRSTHRFDHKTLPY